MEIIAIEIKMYAPWVQSLKEKRMVVKSIISKISNKFRVSVAEINTQDLHKTITIGIAAVAENHAYADSLSAAIEHFVESNTDAEILDYNVELR